MNPWLAIFAVPTFLQSLVVFLLSFPFWRRPVVVRRGLIIVAWRPWFAVRWMYSTTLGIIMGTHDPYNVSEQLLDHEVIHAHRQYVDMNVLGACIGGVVAAFMDWRWGLGIWLSSGMLWLLPNFLTGWIRYGDAYLGSEHERSAYAQTGRPL
jgi:hypothetical protein